jgi:hypothetical protein
MGSAQKTLVFVLFAAIVLQSATPINGQSDPGGLVETIRDKVTGFFQQKPTKAESFSATVREAEETQEAHQRRLQYGDDTWWGALAEKSVRAWQYSSSYYQFARKLLLDYVVAHLPKQLLGHLPRQVTDWLETVQRQAAGAGSATDDIARQAAGFAQDKAAEVVGAASDTVQGGLDAALQRVKEAGDAAGQASGRILEDL